MHLKLLNVHWADSGRLGKRWEVTVGRQTGPDYNAGLEAEGKPRRKLAEPVHPTLGSAAELGPGAEGGEGQGRTGSAH